jgi:hypothetical protein
MLLKQNSFILRTWGLTICLAVGPFLSVSSWGALKESKSPLKVSVLQCSEVFGPFNQRSNSGMEHSGDKSRAKPTVQVMIPESFGWDAQESFFQKKTIFLGGVSVSIAPKFRQSVFLRLRDHYKKSQSVTVISDVNFALEWLKFLEESMPEERAVIVFSEDPDLKRIARDFKQSKIHHLIVTDLGQHEFYADQASLWVDLEAYRSKSSLDIYSKIVKQEKKQGKNPKIYLLKEQLHDALPFAYAKMKIQDSKEDELFEKQEPARISANNLADKLSQYILDHKDDPEGGILPSSKTNPDLIRWISKQKKLHPGQWWINLDKDAIKILEPLGFPETRTQAINVWQKQQDIRTIESKIDELDLEKPTIKERISPSAKDWFKSLTTLNRYGQLYRYILEHKSELLPRRVLPPQSDPTGLGKWLNNLKLRQPDDWWQPLPLDAQNILKQRNLQGLLHRSDEQWMDYYQKAFFAKDTNKKYTGVFSFFPKDEPNLRALQGWWDRLQRRDPMNWWRSFHPDVQNFLRQHRVLLDTDPEFYNESVLQKDQ